MGPIQLGSNESSLEKRWLFGYYDDGSDSAWTSWGRWVMLGVILGVAILFFLFLQITSSRRVRRGQPAIPYTGWMVPPSYHQSQQQQYEDYALPTYKAQPGEGDAGYYRNGEFVPYNHTNTQPAADYSHYGPPDGPPPSQADNNYQPPAGPPPGHSEEAPEAPPAAHVKN